MTGSHPEVSKNPAWLTVINFVSAICGIFCVFLTAKASISNFVFAVINTFVYAVYLTKRIIYLVVALMGLYNWHILNRERNALNV